MAMKANKDNSEKDKLKAGEVSQPESGTSESEAKINTLEKPEEKKKEKVMYIGPNIRGLLQNTVFEYMPDIEKHKEYVNIEKLFVKLPEVKKSILQIKEKSNVLHIIYDEVQKIEDKKRKEREF